MVRYQYVGNMYPLHGARGISRCAARVTTVPPTPRLQLNALYRVESRSRAPPARCRLTAGNSSLRVKLNASCAVRCDVTTTDRTCVCVACLIAHALVCRRLALRRIRCLAWTRSGRDAGHGCRGWSASGGRGSSPGRIPTESGRIIQYPHGTAVDIMFPAVQYSNRRVLTPNSKLR